MYSFINYIKKVNKSIDIEIDSLIILLILVKLKFRYKLGNIIYIGSELIKLFKDPNHKLRKYLPKNLIDEITKTDMIGTYEDDINTKPSIANDLFTTNDIPVTEPSISTEPRLLNKDELHDIMDKVLGPVEDIDNDDILVAIGVINNINNIRDIMVIYQAIRVMETFLLQLNNSNLTNPDEISKIDKFIDKINLLYTKAAELQLVLDKEAKKQVTIDMLNTIIQ